MARVETYRRKFNLQEQYYEGTNAYNRTGFINIHLSVLIFGDLLVKLP